MSGGFDLVIGPDGSPALAESTSTAAPPDRDRHPVPREIRQRLEKTAEGRAWLSEPIRSRPTPRATRSTTTTTARKEQPVRYLSEAEAKRRLNLTDSALRSTELLLRLGARGTAVPGELVFPREIVERAKQWIAEHRDAADRASSELMLSEAGDHPTDDGRRDARQRADELEAEFARFGFDVGSRRRA